VKTVWLNKEAVFSRGQTVEIAAKRAVFSIFGAGMRDIAPPDRLLLGWHFLSAYLRILRQVLFTRRFGYDLVNCYFWHDYGAKFLPKPVSFFVPYAL
jgi:hypothetical protein